MYNYGGVRDHDKYQIYFAESPSLASDLLLICYHCNASIIKEQDEKYIIVAAANQRPIYFHGIDCYEEFLHGMVIFYQGILCKDKHGKRT